MHDQRDHLMDRPASDSDEWWWTDGLLPMTLAALAATAAVLAATIWFGATYLDGTGIGGLGILFLMAAAGGLTVVPAAAGLALRVARRPLAGRTAWVLVNAFVIVGIFNMIVAEGLFFSEALYITLAVEVVVCCAAARAYAIWSSEGHGLKDAVRELFP